jgi:hypothetical protein
MNQKQHMMKKLVVGMPHLLKRKAILIKDIKLDIMIDQLMLVILKVDILHTNKDMMVDMLMLKQNNLMQLFPHQ